MAFQTFQRFDRNTLGFKVLDTFFSAILLDSRKFLPPLIHQPLFQELYFRLMLAHQFLFFSLKFSSNEFRLMLFLLDFEGKLFS